MKGFITRLSLLSLAAFCSFKLTASEAEQNPAYADDTIRFLFVTYKPMTYLENGEVKGEIALRAMQTFEGAGFKVELFPNVPFRRVFHMLSTGEPNLCTAGWFKTPDRLQHAHFTKAINRADETILITTPDNLEAISRHASLQTLMQNKEHRLGLVNGVSSGSGMDDLLEAHQPASIHVQRLEQLFQMLLADRISYFFAEDTVLIQMKDLNISPERLSLLKLPGIPKTEDRYIACSKATSAATMDSLNRVISANQE